MFSLISEVEFFQSPKGQICISQDGKINELELSKYAELLHNLDNEVNEEFPKAFERVDQRVLEKNPNLKVNPYRRSLLRAERFIRCNWGRFDGYADISKDGKLHLENPQCPLKGGSCPDENVICNPERRTQLSDREKECVLALCMGKDVSEIATDLGLQQVSVETYLKKAMKRTGVNDRAKLVAWAFENQLMGIY